MTASHIILSESEREGVLERMTGVEILNEIPFYGTVDWVRIALSCLFVGVILAFAVYGIVKLVKKEEKLGDLFGRTLLGVLVGAISSFAFAAIICTLDIDKDKNDIQYYEYKVVVSDDVNFNEFMEKYEIVDQEGRIYTVRERE